MNKYSMQYAIKWKQLSINWYLFYHLYLYHLIIGCNGRKPTDNLVLNKYGSKTKRVLYKEREEENNSVVKKP